MQDSEDSLEKEKASHCTILGWRILDWQAPWSHKESDRTDSVSPWTVAHQATLSMGFPRLEYWSELPFPSSDIPNLGFKSTCPALAIELFTTEAPGKP